MMQKNAASKGRPREFDREEALESALQLFCQHGYEGVSIVDLTNKMHISPTSLYAAFGNKEELYRKALDRYQRRSDFEMLTDFEMDGPIRDRIRMLLLNSVRAVTCSDYPPGCMVSTGMVYCGPAHEVLAATLRNIRNERCNIILRRLEKAISQGELPANTDAAAVARYLIALIQGIAVQASDKADVRALYGVVEIATNHLLNWLSQRIFYRT